MKVKVTKDKPEFKPVTINVTFENEKEFILFKEMIALNITIPHLLYESDDYNKIKLSNIMKDIHSALTCF